LGRTSCAVCQFPLENEAGGVGRSTSPAAGGGSVPPPLVRPLRARRPRPASNQALSLWLVFGTLAALVVIYIAFKANYDRSARPVEGSSEAQQARADSVLRVLAKDSTNVAARVRLGDILYDTGNWSDAMVQYRAALRLDSSLVPTLVDLGVCYYNLGDPERAEQHFVAALARDPHQPVALFNLGIVCERRKDLHAALQYFHRALQSGPPDDMHQPLIEAMTRVQEKAGAKPPPLPGVQ
jgi:cytochrome c-type biogenesis protein CcmH/NrfG